MEQLFFKDQFPENTGPDNFKTNWSILRSKFAELWVFEVEKNEKIKF